MLFCDHKKFKKSLDDKRAISRALGKIADRGRLEPSTVKLFKIVENENRLFAYRC
jgi:hypothetical protein